jgi:hypothetical protein
MVSRDTLWKGILEDLFDDFLLYFFPTLVENELDLDKGFEFLDKELDELFVQSTAGNRRADKLVKAPKINGMKP